MFFNLSKQQTGGQGVSFNSLNSGEYTIAQAIAFLIQDTVLYILLELYLGKVLPSEWGTNSHPLFCCFCCFSSKTATVVPVETEEEIDRTRIEKVTNPLSVAKVMVTNLTKTFETETGQLTAVGNLNLTLYEDQALVLLGHNGAGKTTAINMLTGMLPVSSGSATIYDVDIVSDIQQARRDIGMCPQHNLLWPSLSCRQHLTFFGKIRGLTGELLKTSVTTMLQDIGLADKADEKSRGLSGGMKRKLSVGIAYIGDPRFVILDEPTAGMDVQARRGIWDLIKKKKKGRVTLLTTHFMDEADLLGDSIAIMHAGKLHSWGSSLFLKSNLGVGYNLKLEINQKCIPRVVQRVVDDNLQTITEGQTDVCESVSSEADVAAPRMQLPEARRNSFSCSITAQSSNELHIIMPLQATHLFPAVLRQLEIRKDELGIKNFGISVTTLEEIFIKIARGDDEVTKPDAEEEVKEKTDGIGDNPGFTVSDDELISGFQLTIAQFKAGLVKRFHYGKRDKRTICFQLLLPMVLIALVLGLSLIPIPNMPKWKLLPEKAEAATAFPSLQSSPGADQIGSYLVSSDGDVINSTWLSLEQELHTGHYEHSLEKLVGGYVDISSQHQYDLSQKKCHVARGNMSLSKDVRMYKRYLNNITLATIFKIQGESISRQQSTLVAHNGTFRHSLPQALLFLDTILLKLKLLEGGADAFVVNSTFLRAWNHPLPNSKGFDTTFESMQTVFIALFILVPFTMVPSTYVSFIVRERQLKSKHVQLISGVSLSAYWLSTFTWDMLCYCVTTTVAFILFFIFDRSEYIGSAENFFGTLLLFMLYGVSAIGCSYWISFFFEAHTKAQSVVLALSVFTGFVLVITANILASIESTTGVSEVLRHCFRVVPSFCLGDGIVSLSLRPFKEQFNINRDGAFNMDIIGWDCLWLSLQIPVAYFGTLAMDFPEVLYFLGLKKKPNDAKDPSTTEIAVSTIEDEDVVQERIVTQSIDPKSDSAKQKYVVVVNNLRKVYSPLGVEPTVAVKTVSFSVLRDEVFCFLGTNGAGKTTTLSIVSGEFPPTSGSAHVGGYDTVTETSSARRELGYCPQFDALLVW